MRPILQDKLAHAPWTTPHLRRLPGVQPLQMADWLIVDEAYAAQLAEKARLTAERLADVHALPSEAEPAAQEVLELVLAWLAQSPQFRVDGRQIRCPDGRVVGIDPAKPLITLSRLLQEDICILQKHGDEHVLTAALVCFPANWTLSEKLGRPLMAVHQPVADYAEDIGKRVQRLFDGIRPDRPLWRANSLFYNDPALFQPRRETDRRDIGNRDAPYLRSERQSLLKLPKTGAVVFTIHTTLIRQTALTADQRQGLADWLG